MASCKHAATCAAAASASLRLVSWPPGKELAGDSAGWTVLAADPPPASHAAGMHGATFGSGSHDGAAGTRLALPAFVLAPGRYVAMLELDAERASLLGGGSSGSSGSSGSLAATLSPADEVGSQGNLTAEDTGMLWRLQVMLNADDKVGRCSRGGAPLTCWHSAALHIACWLATPDCLHPLPLQVCPVVLEDACEHHRGHADGWLAEASTAVGIAAAVVASAAQPATGDAPAGHGRPLGAQPPTATTGTRQQQDRPKAAAAALERHHADSAPVVTKVPLAPSPAPAAATPRRKALGVLIPDALGSCFGSPDASTATCTLLRQAKGPGCIISTLALDPATAVVHVHAGSSATPTSKIPSIVASYPGAEASADRLLAVQVRYSFVTRETRGLAKHVHTC